MKKFLDDNFLLGTKTAEKLYHEFAADLPIVDYHCHLSPQDLADDRSFDNLTEIWLEGDHYKWRAMRANGVDESFITGDRSPEEKFHKWAETVPYTLRNPLYHWTHLELQRYFDITELLNGNTSKETYEEATTLLRTSAFSTKNLVKKMNVEIICTTDDPTSSLEDHQRLLQSQSSFEVFPTFRPDRAFSIWDTEKYNAYLDTLASVCDLPLTTYDELLSALQNRIDFFHEMGCRLSDHGLEQFYIITDKSFDCAKVFSKVRNGSSVNKEEIAFFERSVLIELSRMYHAKGWTQQFHLGALRNTNDRMMSKLGRDTGFDSIGDFPQVEALADFLNELDATDQLARTILYNLNPSNNEAFATMAGNFNDGAIPGKIQFGSGWWFLDQKDGMEKQLNSLSNMGLLSRFVGMVTDSRSFMSYPRHEYFRRILCNLIGNDVENGELPNDMNLLGELVANISYHNAKTYFQFTTNLKKQAVASKV